MTPLVNPFGESISPIIDSRVGSTFSKIVVRNLTCNLRIYVVRTILTAMTRSDDSFRIESINLLKSLAESLNGGPITDEQVDKMWEEDDE